MMACLLSLVAVFGLSSLIPGTLACSCVRAPSLENAYCTPEPGGYLIQAKVVDKSGVFVAPDVRLDLPDDEIDRFYFLENFGRIRYLLSVTDVYVGASRFVRAGHNVTLDARIGGAMCGVRLQLGTTYVLSGALAGNNQLTTELCYYRAGYDSRQQLQLPSCPGGSARRAETTVGDGSDLTALSGDWMMGAAENNAQERAADSNAQHSMSLLDLLIPEE